MFEFHASGTSSRHLILPILVDSGLQAAGVQNPTTRLLLSSAVGVGTGLLLTRTFGMATWEWTRTLANTAALGLMAYAGTRTLSGHGTQSRLFA